MVVPRLKEAGEGIDGGEATSSCVRCGVSTPAYLEACLLSRPDESKSLTLVSGVVNPAVLGSEHQ